MKNKTMAVLVISVICLVCALSFRVAEAVGPGKGEMTKQGVFVGNECTVDSLTVKWNLDSLLGDTIYGNYKYLGNCKPDPSFMIWLRVEHAGTGGYVRIAPALPNKPGTWGFNTPGSPNWDEVLCGYDGTRRVKCLSKASAKRAWKNGRVTGFRVPWSGSGSGSFRGRAASQKPLALDRKKKVLIQRGLASMGFDSGPADGMFGPKTRTAIRSWQRAKGYDESGQTGRLTREQADALAMVGEGTPGRQAKRERAARKARERVETKGKAREKAKRERMARQARERARMERGRRARLARKRAEAERRAREARERAEAKRKAAIPQKPECDQRLEGRWTRSSYGGKYQSIQDISFSTNENGSLVITTRRARRKYPSEIIIDGKLHTTKSSSDSSKLITYAAWCNQKIYRVVSHSRNRGKYLFIKTVSPDGSKMLLSVYREHAYTIEGWDVKNSKATSNPGNRYLFTRE